MASMVVMLLMTLFLASYRLHISSGKVMLWSTPLMRFIGFAIMSAKVMHPAAIAVTYHTAVTPMLYPLDEVPMTDEPPIQPAIHRAPILKLPMDRPPR